MELGKLGTAFHKIDSKMRTDSMLRCEIHLNEVVNNRNNNNKGIRKT